MLDIQPVTPAIGALISGVDLRAPLSESVFEEISAALTEHQVLFFRDQDLDDDQHRAFASRFGRLGRDAMAQYLGDTRDIMYVETNYQADRWHADLAFLAEPPAYGTLNARIIPKTGGDTLWASLFAAYDALSPAMQAFCNDLSVVNRAGSKGYLAERYAEADEAGKARFRETFPPIEHPLVRTHPVSGRPAIYLTASMDHVVGLHPAESDMLLTYLRTLLDDPNIQVRWAWRENDFVIWDQASTNHRALGDYYPAPRKMRRATVQGGRPFHKREAVTI